MSKIKVVLTILLFAVNFSASAQIKFIASFDDKSPSSEDLFIINEIKSLIEERHHLSVQLINEPQIYDGNYIYITPSFTWTRWAEADFWGNPQWILKYERVKLEVTYFPEDREPVTDRYFIGGFTVKKKKGKIKKKLKDFKINFPR